MNELSVKGTTAVLTIRYGTTADAALLAEMGVETFYDAYAPSLPADELATVVAGIFSPELQAAELADPSTLFLIAEVDGVAVGYAMLQDAPPPRALGGTHAVKIPRIYLRQASIGRGVGSALMQACLGEAAGRGFETIWLEVWEHNERARAFYEKWNFAQVGTVEFQFGAETQTDLVLQRSVGAGK